MSAAQRPDHAAYAQGGRRRLPLVGRDEELACVRDALLVHNGVVVTGPAGIGKTRLAADAAQEASAGSALVQIRGSASVSAVPLSAFVQVLPERVSGALPERLRLFQEVEAEVRARAGGSRGLLLVDDAHLLDASSAALLFHVVSTGSAAAVVTVRPGEAMPEPVRRLWADEVLPVLELGPLDRMAVGAFALAALGSPLADLTVSRVARLTRGNPLYLRELLVAVRPDLRAEDGELRWDGPVRVTDRLADLLAARVRHLSPRAVEALQLIALGEPLYLAEAQTLSDVPTLVELERSGLIVSAGDGGRVEVRIEHPMTAETVRATIPPLTAAVLHDRLADAVGRVPGAGRDDQLRAAVWRMRGTAPAEDPELLTAASVSATRSYDPVLGERLARAVLEAAPSAAAGVALGSALVAQRRFEEAEDTLGHWWEAALDSGPADLRFMLCHERAVALTSGLGRGGRAAQLLASAERSRPDRGWRALLRALRSDALTSVDLDAAYELGRPIIEDAASSPLSRLLALRSVVAWLSSAGRTDDALALLDQFSGLSVGLADQYPPGVALVSGLRGYTLGVGGRLADLERTMRAALQSAVSSGSEDAMGGAYLGLGLRAFSAGDMNLARDHLERAVHHLSVADSPAYRPRALIPLAATCAIQGDRTAADAAIRAARQAVGANVSDPYSASELAASEAWCTALAEGPDAGAGTAARAARAARPVVLRSLFAAAAYRLGCREPDVIEIMQSGNTAQSSILRAIAAHGSAVAAGPDGHALEQVAIIYEKTGFLLYAAEAWIEASEAHASSRPSTARRAAARARTLLSGPVTGARTPAVLRLSAPELTGRERQVALAVAAGMSNGEIAAALGRSTRTVEWHLQQAYSKLGVHDRSSLAEVLSGVRTGAIH